MSVKQIFNTSAELDYPTVLPTLDLDFANSKTLDPRITFTRASGGSYVGADGLIKYAGVNEARFDHDPYTGESLGFLVEEARTNLVTYSEQFDNANWTKPSTTVTANATTAPDGTLTADRLLETATTSTFYVGALGVTNTPGTYTFSVYAKGDGSGRLLNMTFYNGSYLQSYFNLSTGVVSNVNAGLTASIQSLPNGWFRCSVTGGLTIGYLYILLYSAVAAGENTVNIARAGSASAGLYLWGCQGEAGAFPTSYIPTEGSSRTRAADVASITGKNFSSWYNQSEGTLFAAQRSDTIQDAYQTSTFTLCSSNPNAHFIGMEVTNDYNRFYVYGGATTAQNYNYLPVTPGTLTKNVLAYANNNVAAARNGGTVVTDSSVAIPIYSYDSATGDFEINRATIGHNLVYGNQKRQHLSRLAYYPKRLTDAQLQVLTS